MDGRTDLHRRNAFTLIELLVVIAVIALLIGVLLPSLSGSRKTARMVKCLAQQKQVAMAMMSYSMTAKDMWHLVWDNEAPRVRSSFGANYYLIRPYIVTAAGDLDDTDAYWAALYDSELGINIQQSMYDVTGGIGSIPRLGGWEVTKCPEAKYTLPAFRNNGALPHDPYTLYSSYCMNGVTPGFDAVPDTAARTFFEKKRIGSTDRRVPRKLTDVMFPSGIIMFQDGSEVMLDGNGDTLIQLTQWDTLPAPDNTMWEKEYFRHLDTCAVAWADGHVATKSRADCQNMRAEVIRMYGSTTGVPLPWYSTPGLR